MAPKKRKRQSIRDNAANAVAGAAASAAASAGKTPSQLAIWMERVFLLCESACAESDASLSCSWQFKFLWFVVCEILMRLFLMFLSVEIPMKKKELQCFMVSWGHFSPQVAQHAMMLFEGDLERHSGGMLDLGLVNSMSQCGDYGADMRKHGAREFWNIWSKKLHIAPTPFDVPLQTRGREDL